MYLKTISFYGAYSAYFNLGKKILRSISKTVNTVSIQNMPINTVGLYKHTLAWRVPSNQVLLMNSIFQDNQTSIFYKETCYATKCLIWFDHT